VKETKGVNSRSWLILWRIYTCLLCAHFQKNVCRNVFHLDVLNILKKWMFRMQLVEINQIKYTSEFCVIVWRFWALKTSKFEHILTLCMNWQRSLVSTVLVICSNLKKVGHCWTYFRKQWRYHTGWKLNNILNSTRTCTHAQIQVRVLNDTHVHTHIQTHIDHSWLHEWILPFRKFWMVYTILEQQPQGKIIMILRIGKDLVFPLLYIFVCIDAGKDKYQWVYACMSYVCM